MSAKYSKSALNHLAKSQFPLGIKLDTRDLSEERYFCIVVGCNNDNLLAVKDAVNTFLNRECNFTETICDSRHSNVAFWGTGYEYEKICESGVLVRVLY